MCENRDGWLVAWGLCGCILIRFLPAPDPVLHMSAPVRRGAVADARLGLA